MDEVEVDQVILSLSSDTDLPYKTVWAYKRTTGLIKRWQLRFLALGNRKLTYRRSISKTKALRTLDFDQLTVELKAVHSTIEITPRKSKRSFTFKFPSEEVAEDWLVALRLHIEDSRGRLRELPHFAGLRHYWRHCYISEQSFISTASTGDVILFQGKSNLAKTQRFFTRSKYDHVGLVLRYSSGDLGFFQAIQGEGVSVVSWETFKDNHWEDLYSMVSYRQLTAVRSEEMLHKLQTFVGRVSGRRYRPSLAKLCGTRRTNPTNEVDYFSSELVAVCLQVMGLLNQYVNPGRFLPGNFSGKSDLALLEGARLGPELIIDFQIN
jgi:hypothetical protein